MVTGGTEIRWFHIVTSRLKITDSCSLYLPEINDFWRTDIQMLAPLTHILTEIEQGKKRTVAIREGT